MSKILDETKAEIEELYNLGLVSADDYENVVKLTARDIDIPPPIAYEGTRLLLSGKSYAVHKKFLPTFLE